MFRDAAESQLAAARLLLARGLCARGCSASDAGIIALIERASKSQSGLVCRDLRMFLYHFLSVSESVPESIRLPFALLPASGLVTMLPEDDGGEHEQSLPCYCFENGRYDAVFSLSTFAKLLPFSNPFIASVFVKSFLLAAPPSVTGW